MLRAEEENVRCNEALPLLRLIWFASDASDATAVSERCRDSGEAGTDALAGGRSVTRPLITELGPSPVLTRADIFLKGDGARGNGGWLAGDFGLLVLVIELEPDTLRAIGTLLFT